MPAAKQCNLFHGADVLFNAYHRLTEHRKENMLKKVTTVDG